MRRRKAVSPPTGDRRCTPLALDWCWTLVWDALVQGMLVNASKMTQKSSKGESKQHGSDGACRAGHGILSQASKSQLTAVPSLSPYFLEA